ncbi:MAG: ROK family protein [Clostridia bacterium]|nr:ROK family protein [Clostridia bacterium]
MALKQKTAEAAKANPNSLLSAMCAEHISGQTAFRAAEEGCEVAKAVLDEYFDYLAAGIMNLIKIFDPNAVIISGGLSNEGESIIDELINRLMPFKNIKLASLRNDAGIIGAASLRNRNK